MTTYGVVIKMADWDSDSDDEGRRRRQLAIVVAAAAATTAVLRARPKRLWSRRWISSRNRLGAYATLVRELVEEDPFSYRRFVRMSLANFRELLELVDPLIRRKDTVMRRAIKPEERLAVTLRYLGSGNSFADLAFLFRIASNTIHGIVMETCEAIFTVLKEEYMKVPNTPAEWKRVAQEFEHRWNLPNCIGAMDGKHVEIMSPGEGSAYFNYLKYHSIIMLAVVDARYRFLYVDVGTNGRAGDAAVFRDSNLARALEDNSLHIPEPTPLPGREMPVPFFLVGDDAFPLKQYLMKPYPFKKVMNNLNDPDEEAERKKQRIFDYRLSRARRISENAFGILAARFQIFHKAMPHSPDRVTAITLSCVALHNFLMSKRDDSFVPPSLVDREREDTHEVIQGDWRHNHHQLRDVGCNPVNRSTQDAREVRHEIKNYVNEEGAVPWQDRLVFGTNQ